MTEFFRRLGDAARGDEYSLDADSNSQVSEAVSAATHQYIDLEQNSDVISRIQERVLQNHERLLQKSREDRKARERLYRLVDTMLTESGESLAGVSRTELVRDIGQRLLGYGPLTEILSNDEITEIMVNGPDQIWIERAGKLKLTNYRFRSHDQLRDVVERIFAPLGRRIDLAHPWADGRLPDGSRAHALLRPVAVGGPYLTIRKFNHSTFHLSDLVEMQALSQEMVEFLCDAVKSARNLLVSGAAGTGKTTLLNALSREIPATERVITIEDAAELKLQHKHWLHLETRLPNAEGSGAVTIRDLVRNALRMRPDRLIIGEVRGREAFELLVALTTGHAGAMATIHASSPKHALRRMSHLVQMADSGLPHSVIVEQVRDVVDLGIHLSRTEEGVRRVTSIAAISEDTNSVSTLFSYEAEEGFMNHVDQ